MEKLLREIKGVLVAIALLFGAQIIAQSCSAAEIHEQIERIANKMPSDAAPDVWARALYNEFGGNLCGGRK